MYDPEDEARAVLKGLKSRGCFNKGMLTLESTRPEPGHLRMFARKAVDNMGSIIPDKTLFGIIHGPSPYIDWVIIEAEELTEKATSGFWIPDGMEGKCWLGDCQVIQAARLDTPDGTEFLTGEAALIGCQALNFAYQWETRVSRLAIPESALVVSRQLQPTYSDRLVKEYRPPIASMDHRESKEIYIKLFEKISNRGHLFGTKEPSKYEKKPPEPDTIWIFGNVKREPSDGQFGLGKVMIFWFLERQVRQFILLYPLSQQKLGENWHPYGETGLFYSPVKAGKTDIINSAWYMCDDRAGLTPDRRMIYTPAQALPHIAYRVKREGGMDRFEGICLPEVPSSYYSLSD